MRILATSTCVLVGVMLGVGVQTPPVPLDQQYVFIDGEKTALFSNRSNVGCTRRFDQRRVHERLMDAGNKGYGVYFVSLGRMLLKRDGLGPRMYRLVTSGNLPLRKGSFLYALNAEGSQGFRLLADGTWVVQEANVEKDSEGDFVTSLLWVAVMVRQSNAPRFKYTLVEGTTEGEQALAESVATGRVLKTILGTKPPLFVFEEVEGGTSPATALGQREYWIVTDVGTIDFTKAAAAGFRVIGAGSKPMTVVMARDRGSTPEPIEYRLVDTFRVGTAVRELDAAGAEGFRVAEMLGAEKVFILHRTRGTSERVDYEMLELDSASANRTLLDAEADGYRIIGLLGDQAVLERPY